MIGFVGIAALMTLAALALVLRRAQPRSTATRRGTNTMIHASELALLDRELATRAIGADAHRAARDEVLRRVIAEGGEERAGAGEGRLPVVAIALTVPAVAVVLYLLVGNPAALLQRGEAPTQPAGAMAASSVAELEAYLRQSPRDGRAWVILARLHMGADRYGAAAEAYEQAVGVAPKIAADPQIWCEWADALGMAQGGRLSGRPATLIDRALALKPGHPRALEMAGGAAYEAGRPDVALAHWEALLSQLAPGSDEYRELDIAVGRMRTLAAASR